MICFLSKYQEQKRPQKIAWVLFKENLPGVERNEPLRIAVKNNQGLEALRGRTVFAPVFTRPNNRFCLFDLHRLDRGYCLGVKALNHKKER